MKSLVLLGASVALSLLVSPAHADRRAYGVTYEAVTAPRGELDVESWTTLAPGGEIPGGPASRGVRQMIELEYGITDHWDLALYNMLDGISGGDTASGYAGFKLETRWRPADRGAWAIDPVLYLEFQQLFRGDARQKYEAKLIVAKDLGDLNLAANVAVEEERTTEPAWNTEVELAAGASYALTPAWTIGAEWFGKAEKEEANGMSEIELASWAGPAVSWAGGGGGGPLAGLWVTLAGGARVTGGGDDYYARAIIGLQFH